MTRVKVIWLCITFFFKEILSDSPDKTSSWLSCSSLGDVTFNMYDNGDFDSDKVAVTFYLSTPKRKTPAKIDVKDWSALHECVFDVTEKTVVIIHGLLSSATEDWVSNMVEALSEENNFNIITVDWSSLAKTLLAVPMYISVSQQIVMVTVAIVKFFQELREHIKTLKLPKENIKWNKLYFIGHSLGAHLSAQTAHVLKLDKFWHVERITGLDPAGPCFHYSNQFKKVDSADADFVDIIHTQSQNNYFSLGTNNVVGDADFYVNGGISQPLCEKQMPLLPPDWTPDLIRYFVGSACSHTLAQQYFTESIKNPKKRKCRFDAHRWDGDYPHAKLIMDKVFKGFSLPDTFPEMGFYASKKTTKGVYLVVTGAQSPFCVVTEGDKTVLGIVEARLKNYGHQVHVPKSKKSTQLNGHPKHEHHHGVSTTEEKELKK